MNANRQLKLASCGAFARHLTVTFTKLIVLSSICFGTLAQADMVYTPNGDSNNVSVIDTNTNKVVATVAVGTNPWGVALNSAGTRAYVTNRGSNNVSVINTETNTVIGQPIPVGTKPNGVAVNPTGTRVYVTNYIGDNTVSVIDVTNDKNSVIATIPVSQSPWAVIVNPTGTRAYVTSQGGGLSVIDTVTNTVIKNIALGQNPTFLAINPSGTFIYAANVLGNDVSVVDTVTNSVVATIKVGNYPVGVAMSPDGTRVYVINENSNTISVIDTASNKVISTFSILTKAYYWGVAINSSGTRLYVSSNNNTITTIDTLTGSEIATVPVGVYPWFVAIRSQNNSCPADTNGSTQAGIEQCKVNPASCGIPTVTDQCKTDPKSCGLFTQAEIDTAKQTGKQTGIDQCKTNPTSCNIVTTTDQCKTNPASCGLFTQTQLDAAKQAGISQCTTNPSACGINAGITTRIDGIATNAFVTPNNKMIAGVLISGGAKRVMVRASSVDGAVDPLLEIVTYPDRKPLGSNDSWATDPAATELTQKKLAPARATDAATILTLPTGLFTMEITSKNGGSGANVIEVYDMAVFP